MKTIRELRTTLRFHPQEINTSVKFFAEQVSLDFNVYLPSIKMNLQRELVWNDLQKSELIMSILMNRHIPRMAVVCTYNMTYQVIDGKQRLSTMIDYYNDKFSIKIEDYPIYFSGLPLDYQKVIENYYCPYYIVHEEREGTITDQDKIDWFKYINFAGTQQELAHLNNLTKK